MRWLQTNPGGKPESGVTLVEVMVVVGLLGIISFAVMGVVEMLGKGSKTALSRAETSVQLDFMIKQLRRDAGRARPEASGLISLTAYSGSHVNIVQRPASPLSMIPDSLTYLSRCTPTSQLVPNNKVAEMHAPCASPSCPVGSVPQIFRSRRYYEPNAMGYSTLRITESPFPKGIGGNLIATSACFDRPLVGTPPRPGRFLQAWLSVLWRKSDGGLEVMRRAVTVPVSSGASGNVLLSP